MDPFSSKLCCVKVSCILNLVRLFYGSRYGLSWWEFHGHFIRMYILLWFHEALYVCLPDPVAWLCSQVCISLLIFCMIAYHLPRAGCWCLQLWVWLSTAISALVLVTRMGSYYTHIASSSSYPTMSCDDLFQPITIRL